jgi:hypothetical protein
MEHLADVLVGEEPPERLEIEALGERIDDRRAIGARHLDEAEDRPVGGLAHELRIDRDIVVVREVVHQRLQRFGRRDDIHRAPNPLLRRALP